MSRRRALSVAAHLVQPALPLGHADVRWEALPPNVQGEVLAHWCTMLHEAMRASTDTGATAAELRS